MLRQSKGVEVSIMSYRKQILQILLLFFSMPCLDCWAQQLSANEIMLRVRETYRGLQSYQFVAEEFVEILPGRTSKSVISLSYSAPGKIRLEVRDDDGTRLLVSDGRTRWIYMPNRKEYVTEPGSGDETVTKGGHKLATPTYRSMLVDRFLKLPDEGSSAVVGEERRLKVGTNTVVCYFVDVQKQDGSKDELWVDKDRYIVWESRHVPAKVAKGSLPTITIRLLSAKINTELEKSTFQFAPPPMSRKCAHLSEHSV